MKSYLILFTIFFGLGFFVGFLFRDVGFWKALAILFIVPNILILVEALNFWVSTVAFLCGAGISFFRLKSE